MTQQIEHSVEYGCTTADLMRAFSSEVYWKERVAEIGNDSSVVHHSAEDGSIESVLEQCISSDELPKTLRRFGGPVIRTRCEENWSVGTDGSATGDYTLTGVSIPMRISGSLDSRASGSGTSVLRFTGTLEVTIPVFGPVAEKLMTGEVAKSFEVEREFTIRWLEQN